MRHLLLLAVLLFLLTGSVFAHPPTGIVCDKNGNIYFTDLETIWKFERGSVSVFRPGVSGRHVHELAIDASGNVYGADLSYESEKWISSVWKMTPKRVITYLAGPTDNLPRGMSMWLDSHGRMYLADQNNHTKKETLILQRTPEGQVATFAGSAYGYADGKGTDAKFTSVGGLFITPDDTIYLTDSPHLRKIATDGTVTTVAKDLGINGGSLTGLTVDGQGTVYVADAGNKRLLKVYKDGQVLPVYSGTEPYYPNGVTVAANGDLYVLEVSSKPDLKPRVRNVSANGQNSIVAESAEQSGTKSQAASPPVVQESSFPENEMRLVYLIVLLAGIITLWQVKKRR